MKTVLISIGLLLTACAGQPMKPAPLKQTLIHLALNEWAYFGQQKVVFQDEREIINPVGHWEDEAPWSERVRRYWQSVGRADLSGQDCQEPWSAAFISWLMRTAQIPEQAFQPADAHWVYLDRILQNAGQPNALFIPHKLADYKPVAGDLVCAYREPEARIKSIENLPLIPADTRLHCDLVVEVSGGVLVAVGGNVRNAVSKSEIPLGKGGYLTPIPKRHWFLVVEMKG